jgi:16S rRNA (guanine966-N2)-methyltransferase
MPEHGRVIAGTARGTRLDAPSSGTRPLTDRVKESLFAGLEAGGALDGPFLDLFAGSGAAGIEALSRGAPSATFVERDGRSCEVIGANLRRARLERGHVVRADVGAFLRREKAPHEAPYRAVLIDPPYGEQSLETALQLLGENSEAWLEPVATVVAKHFWRDEPPATTGLLTITRQRRFGETMLTFYTREQRADHSGTL